MSRQVRRGHGRMYAMGAITEQGLFGIVAAIVGVTAGIWLSRTLRSRFGIGQRKPDAKPPVYASRQEMRKAERERAKKEGH
jgi:hypothetical protein